VGYMPRKIADGAVRIQKSGPLSTRFTVAQQFHGCFLSCVKCGWHAAARAAPWPACHGHPGRRAAHSESNRPAAIDIVSLTGRVGGARQVYGEIGNLLRRTEAPHGLASYEGGTRGLIVTQRPHPPLQRGRFHRAWANGIAANAL